MARARGGQRFPATEALTPNSDIRHPQTCEYAVRNKKVGNDSNSGCSPLAAALPWDSAQEHRLKPEIEVAGIPHVGIPAFQLTQVPGISVAGFRPRQLLGRS